MINFYIYCVLFTVVSLLFLLLLETDQIWWYLILRLKKVFIHVARFHKQKNQKLLIDAFNTINERGVDFTLLVLGSGFDSLEAEDLIKGACEKIHFIGLRSNVGDYLACADAFCLTSLYEGLPISLLESMAMNVVPICTPVGGGVDVVEEGKSGFLSDDLSVESYVSAVLRFISDTGKHIRLDEIYKKKYSMESCASQYIEYYNQCKKQTI